VADPRLVGGTVGLTQNPNLRYEAGVLTVDDMLFEPPVCPLGGGE
jgi:hypothetical protein